MFYPMVARQKKVVRNCEISIIMENRINKCNISISALLFFFSIHSSGTQELHPHENRKSGNLAKTQCIKLCRTNSTYNYSSYFPCIVRGQKESTDTVREPFTFSFFYREGLEGRKPLNVCFKLSKYITHLCIKIGANSAFKKTVFLLWLVKNVFTKCMYLHTTVKSSHQITAFKGCMRRETYAYLSPVRTVQTPTFFFNMKFLI